MWIDIHTKPKQGTPLWLNQSMLMNIPFGYDDEYRQKTPILCFYQQQRNHSLYLTLVPTLKLDMQRLRILITKGVCWGTVPTAHLLQLIKPRTELTWAELTCYLRGLPTEQRYLPGLMWRVEIRFKAQACLPVAMAAINADYLGWQGRTCLDIQWRLSALLMLPFLIVFGCNI